MIFQEIEDKFSILDEIPETLYTELVTHSHGELIPRVKAILHWRACMLVGRLPEEIELDWPEALIKRTLLMRLETLDIVRYCIEQETLTDNILLDILEGVSSAEDYFALKPGGFVDKLAQRQKIKDQDSSFKDEDGLADHVESPSSGAEQADPNETETHSKEGSDSHRGEPVGDGVAQQVRNVETDDTGSSVSDHVGLNRANLMPVPSELLGTDTQAFSSMLDAVVSQHLEQNWLELAHSWHELSSVYEELGGLLGRGWDLSQGVLAAEGWRDIVRYRKLLKQLPELEQLMAILGRLRDVVGDEKFNSLNEQVFNSIKRQVVAEQDKRTRRTAMETGGIVLSDDLSRLLPSELALLGHPKFKMLWYAKRAEKKLLTYCHCGLIPDPMLLERETDTDGLPQQQERSGRAFGPIIICLDTSGSMEGIPENIAKALVLEGLRIAFNEQRPCFVYSFGGPEQVLEHELDLTRGGLTQLLKFLQQSFHGGTDVVRPLLLALEKQRAEVWRDADILLITDGRFPLQSDLFHRIEKLKKRQGLRLHGLLLGNWKSRAIERLCDPLHRYSAWNRE